ncbi:MAG: hypothetical protein KBT27_09255 [Prevotellaceae bacterium]|nr:hypothetical protein [Candidatus Faecinaster equi]
MNKMDQWLLNGDCRICRRAPYCNKPCKPFKNNVDKAYTELMKEERDEGRDQTGTEETS